MTAAEEGMASAFARIQRLAAEVALPGVEAGTSYGTPALKVRGKLFARIKDAETLVIMVSHADKAMLMEGAPEIFYQTDHYQGWPAVLVRLPAIGDDELGVRLLQAWRHRAPKTLLKAFDRGA